MNLKERQGLQVGRSDPGGSVSSFGGILISTIIMGFTLLIITIFRKIIDIIG